VEYRERYPAEFAKFTAADVDKPTDNAKKVTAEYDNSVLYTDFILDEIFKRFEDKNALIIYISDHGEEVFENGNDYAGHTPEEKGNRSTIEIPMIVWTSEKFREMYPEKISALKNAENNPYRTDLIIHTILDLMDIQTESFNPTKSIVNEKFDKFRIRIYNNKPYIRD
jgi:heptose-I-phosphate ethanolaminephosphotransferase